MLLTLVRVDLSMSVFKLFSMAAAKTMEEAITPAPFQVGTPGFMNCPRSVVQTLKGTSCSSLLPASSTLPKSAKSKSKQLTKAQVRTRLQGSNAEERSGKRAKYKEEYVDAPRFPGQSFLEQRAVWDHCALDYQIRQEVIKDFFATKVLSLASNPDLDHGLVLLLNQGFDEGWEQPEASKYLAAFMDLHPYTRPASILVRSRRCLQGWSNLDFLRSRPPIHWYLLALIFLEMLEDNCHQEVLAALTSFTTYGRPVEIFKLREQDLSKPPLEHHHILNFHSSMVLETSKTGLTDQSILLNSPTVPWLGDLLERNKCNQPISPLFKTSYGALRKSWERALVKLRLKKDFAVLYQLRHSGPSWDRSQNHRSIPEIKDRGGWQSDKSLRRYENHAMVSANFQKLTKTLQRQAIAAPALLEARLR